MLHVMYLPGLVGYEEACRLQRKLLYQRYNGEIEDTLVILEHPPTYTIGKSGSLDNVLARQAYLSRENISVFFTDRGGNVTYHGPGQLVGYPVIDLRGRGKDIHRYVHELEEVLIRTLKSFSLSSGRDKGHPGVWVNNEEIAAIGIAIKKWITMHGFALNVNPALEHFSFINPCGFSDRKTTSMTALLGVDIPMEKVVDRLITHFSDVFNTSVAWSPHSQLSHCL